jgi:heme-degrading monooxygenase HmoA
MHFEPAQVPAFLELFEERKQTIRNFTGCQHLELWRHDTDECSFFTYSKWNSTEDLDHYRFSPFFKDTWGKTKAMFSAKAEAWSVRQHTVVADKSTI